MCSLALEMLLCLHYASINTNAIHNFPPALNNNSTNPFYFKRKNPNKILKIPYKVLYLFSLSLVLNRRLRVAKVARNGNECCLFFVIVHLQTHTQTIYTH